MGHHRYGISSLSEDESAGRELPKLTASEGLFCNPMYYNILNQNFRIVHGLITKLKGNILVPWKSFHIYFIPR